MSQDLKDKQTHRITSTELTQLNSPYLQHLKGPLNNEGLRPLPPEHWQPHHCVLVSSAEKLRDFISQGAPIIVCLQDKIPSDLEVGHSDVFLTPSISAGLATLQSLFDDKLSRFSNQIHPTAVISSTAKLGPQCRIGPYAIIGDGVELGGHTIVGAHSVIEKNVKIGDRTLIHPHVFIGADCIVGKHCEIHPHTTIGSDGFGFVKDPKGKFHKIPQLGNVVIEDYVEIGSNCAIDRAVMQSTFIRAGAKLDNLIHIAHNCDIGGDSAIAAGFMCAGSTEIGRGFMAGGDVVVADHLKVAANVTLGGRAGVTKDITQAGVYVGYPSEPYSKGMKIMATLSNLPEMKKQLNRVLKQLGLDKENL